MYRMLPHNRLCDEHHEQYLIKPLKLSYKLSIIIPILQMMKVWLRKFEKFSISHSEYKYRARILTTSSDSKAHAYIKNIILLSFVNFSAWLC